MQHDDPHSQDRESDAAHEAPHRTEDDTGGRTLRRIEASVHDLPPCHPVAAYSLKASRSTVRTAARSRSSTTGPIPSM